MNPTAFVDTANFGRVFYDQPMAGQIAWAQAHAEMLAACQAAGIVSQYYGVGKWQCKWCGSNSPASTCKNCGGPN